VQQAVGVHKGFTYSRAANPTVDALERALAALEGTPATVCFATGMAAITTLFLSLLKSGDHVVISEVVYGGTVRLCQQLLSGLGIEHSLVDASRAELVEQAITPRTKLIFIETPGNPTLKLCDIPAIAAVARRHGVRLAVDNTFLTPVLQPVFQLGADISVLSTTKYIEGHNATVGGSLATHDEQLLERFRLIRKTTGCIQSPQDAWLTLRGIKTLPVRLKLHSENAAIVAQWLESHPAVERVHYPGLASFPQKALAERQHVAHGGMLAFEITAGAEAAVELMNSVRLCSLAENLGAVETLITHPASMTHGDVPVATRKAIGITDGLIRLSVGLESPEDIIADLEQALAVATEKAGRASCIVTR
jgi:cystathionine beta-lyase/cystathionine gamma-synthase